MVSEWRQDWGTTAVGGARFALEPSLLPSCHWRRDRVKSERREKCVGISEARGWERTYGSVAFVRGRHHFRRREDASANTTRILDPTRGGWNRTSSNGVYDWHGNAQLQNESIVPRDLSSKPCWFMLGDAYYRRKSRRILMGRGDVVGRGPVETSRTSPSSIW